MNLDARRGGASSDSCPRGILRQVAKALATEGYDPARQLAGYLLSGDPAHITSREGARSLIRRWDREVLLELLVRHYVEEGLEGNQAFDTHSG